MGRCVDECPHRRPIADGPPDVAVCEFLRTMTGVTEGARLHVRRDLCEACCASLPPTERYLNPPLASRIYDLTAQILAEGTADPTACSRHELLLAMAEESLAVEGIYRPPALDRSRPPTDTHSDGQPASARVGLLGENSRRGLGTLCRDFARNYPVECWYMPFEIAEVDRPPEVRCAVSDDIAPGATGSFPSGLDWVLFFEQPWRLDLLEKAREHGVKIACVPMWEYLDDASPWLPYVDLMIAPTRHCHELLPGWRERLGLSWEIAFLPWPIDVDRFPFRARTRCERFLFINGVGGSRELDRRRDVWDGRKGATIVAEAARRAPGVSILVLSQTDNLPAFPPNVEVRVGNPRESAALYRDGDVCIQPSRWEGLGLPLLECQASGLPLVTTDAPPMNEHNPLRSLGCVQSRGRVCGVRTIPVHEVDPTSLAHTFQSLYGADITEASLAARRFVESSHSWPAALPRLQSLFHHHAG
jgi:Glycosyl transferases group 1